MPPLGRSRFVSRANATVSSKRKREAQVCENLHRSSVRPALPVSGNGTRLFHRAGRHCVVDGGEELYDVENGDREALVQKSRVLHKEGKHKAQWDSRSVKHMEGQAQGTNGIRVVAQNASGDYDSVRLWPSKGGRGDTYVEVPNGTRLVVLAREDKWLHVQHNEGSHWIKRSNAEVDTEELSSATKRVLLSGRIINQREIYRDKVQGRFIPGRLQELTENGKSDEDGDETTNFTMAERDSTDQDYLMKENAKKQLIQARSDEEVLTKAELLIEEDWLDKIDALPGNLYTLAAFGDLIPDDVDGFSFAKLKGYSKWIGAFLIITVQLVGPLLIFFSKMPQHVGVVDSNMYEWRCLPIPLLGKLFDGMYDPSNAEQMAMKCPGDKFPNEVSLIDDWKHIASTKAMSIVFILLFILNGAFVLIEEKTTWKNVYNIFRFLDVMNEKFKMSGYGWLMLGAFVNSWVVLWTCVDMYVVVGASASPQDLLMDALGLLFLYNLDDISGDLGFINEDDWPALRIAWIYHELVEDWPDNDADEGTVWVFERRENEGGGITRWHNMSDDDENVLYPDQEAKLKTLKGFNEDNLDWRGTIGLAWYNITIGLVFVAIFVIPTLAAFTPFTQIAQ